MDEAEYNVKYYVDRREDIRLLESKQRLRQISNFEIRKNVLLFELIFCVFSYCLCQQFAYFVLGKIFRALVDTDTQKCFMIAFFGAPKVLPKSKNISSSIH